MTPFQGTWTIGAAEAEDERRPRRVHVRRRRLRELGERIFTTRSEAAFSEWQLLELRSDGTLPPALGGPGAQLTIARVP